MKNQVTDIKVEKVKEPTLDNIYSVTYRENGKTKTKEVRKSLNVVKILLYHEEKNAFLIIRQFRPLVYINQPDAAFRYELCGGREDKESLSSLQIAQEEVIEECGYKVDNLELITTFYTGARMNLYYGVINESMKVNSGGGIDDENIELIFLPINEAKEFVLNPNYPKRPSLAFSFWWFFDTKAKKLRT